MVNLINFDMKFCDFFQYLCLKISNMLFCLYLLTVVITGKGMFINDLLFLVHFKTTYKIFGTSP